MPFLIAREVRRLHLVKHAILIILASVILADSALCQRAGTPSFGSYPAAVEKARAKRINLRSHPQARMFRTVLGEYLSSGVNFAGHYVLAEWGCGAGCSVGAVIDARNGNVFFPGQLAGMSSSWTCNVEDETTFRKNSRLLVISGAPASRQEKPCGKYYYEWKNNRFRLVKFIGKKNN